MSSIAVALALLAVLPSIGAASEHGTQQAHWAYRGEEGPSHWAQADRSFRACSAGKAQSPIDVRAHGPKKPLALRRDYHGAFSPLHDSGHAWQSEPESSDHLFWGGSEYTLENVHFHAPSEHRIEGRPFPLEAHFVHRGRDGALAVVSVLYRTGEPSAFLEGIARHRTAASAADFERGPFAHYTGSLTTPPCTERVEWLVLLEPQTASIPQLRRLAHPSGPNARPLQPVSRRPINLEGS